LSNDLAELARSALRHRILDQTNDESEYSATRTTADQLADDRSKIDAAAARGAGKRRNQRT
jgi:hypothetical protein